MTNTTRSSLLASSRLWLLAVTVAALVATPGDGRRASPTPAEDGLRLAPAGARPAPTFPWSVGPDGEIALERGGGERFTLATSAMTVGSRELEVTATDSARGGASDIETRRQRVVEHATVEESGVEQSWTFAEPPDGSGDLTVRVSTAGGRFARRSADGALLFGERAPYVRYGRATWIDAEHRTTVVAAHVEDNSIVLTVPARTLLASAYPAVLDPLVSPEFEIDVSATTESAENAQAPSIASDGTNAFLICADNRLDGQLSDVPAVFGARVGPGGTLLDPSNVRIAMSPYGVPSGAGNSTALAFDGTNYCAFYATDVGVTLTRVTPAGIVLDPDGILVAAASTQLGNASQRLAAASDGTNTLVAYLDADANPSNSYDTDLKLVLVDGSGTVVATPTATAWNDNDNAPFIAWGGGNYLVGSGTIGRYFDAAGTPGASVTLPASGSSHPDRSAAQVASDGTDFAAVYFGGPQASISAVCIGTCATWVSRTTVAPTGPGGSAPDEAPQISFDGANYVVTWSDWSSGNATVKAVRVSTSGAVLDAAAIQLDAAGLRTVTQIDPVSVAVLGGTLVAFQQSATDPRNGVVTSVQGARLTSAGTAPDIARGIAISQHANEQEQPAVAFDGANYMAAWLDFRDVDTYGYTDPRVYAARIAPTGEVLDPAGISLGDSVTPGLSPSIAFDGANYFVSWSGDSAAPAGVVGRRVSTAGVALDASPITVTTSGTGTALAFGGGVYLDVFTVSGDVHAVRVDPSGAILDPTGFAVATPAELTGLPAGFSPSVTFDGADFAVVIGNYVVRVSPSGTVRDIPPIDLGTTYPPSCVACKPGQECLVFFAGAARAQRVAIDGGVIDPTGLVVSDGGTSGYPVCAAAWDGTQFVVSWVELGVADGVPQLPLGQLRSAYIQSSDSTTPPSAFTSSSDVATYTGAAGVGNGAGGSLAVYTRYDSVSPFGVVRVRGRFVGNGSWQDGGVLTSGSADGGTPDGGGTDGGSVDAATGSDSGGAVDAAATVDGGSTDMDATSPTDGGGSSTGGAGGCSCDAAGRGSREGAGLAALIALCACAVLRRRRVLCSMPIESPATRETTRSTARAG